MYPPLRVPPLPQVIAEDSEIELPQETCASDPPVRLTCRESLSPFHMLFLAHTLKAKNWTPKLLPPRRPWADDHGRCIPSSGAGRHNGSTTSQGRHISSGHRYESRRECLSCVRRTPAPLTSGTKERLADRQAIHSGPRDWTRYQRGVSAGADVCCPRWQRCSGASTSNTFRKWQTSLIPSHVKNWMMKGRKEGGRGAHHI